MKIYTCRCGHEVLAYDLPREIQWTDGHVCVFKEPSDTWWWCCGIVRPINESCSCGETSD